MKTTFTRILMKEKRPIKMEMRMMKLKNKIIMTIWSKIKKITKNKKKLSKLNNHKQNRLRHIKIQIRNMKKKRIRNSKLEKAYIMILNWSRRERIFGKYSE
jgi:seryl-tRNA synthetase